MTRSILYTFDGGNVTMSLRNENDIEIHTHTFTDPGISEVAAAFGARCGDVTGAFGITGTPSLLVP